MVCFFVLLQGWTVMARVFGKSPIRQYTNEKGAGQVANVTLIDVSGQMKVRHAASTHSSVF